MGFLNKHKPFFSDLGLVYCAAIWGSTFFIVKESLFNVNPVMLVAYRFLIAAIILALFLNKKKLFENWKQGLILGTLIAILYLTQTLGLKYTTASNSGFITGLFIIFVPIFSISLLLSQPIQKLYHHKILCPDSQ